MMYPRKQKAMGGAALLLVALLSLGSAVLFASVATDNAWADDDVCAYAYLEPADNAQDRAYKLVLQSERRNETSAGYYDCGPIPSDGRYSDFDESAQEPPWQDFSWLDYDEDDGDYPRIVQVSIADTIHPKATYAWFSGVDCEAVDLSNIDFSEVTDISCMFSNSAITNISFANADLSKVEFADSLFAGCENLTTIDLSSVSMPSVRNAWGMFSNCTSLENVKLPVFGNGVLEDIGYLLSDCELLESADLNGLTVSAGIDDENVDGVFSGCPLLEEVKAQPSLTNPVVFSSLFENDAKTWTPRGNEEVICHDGYEIVDYLATVGVPVTFDAIDNAPVIVAVEDTQSKTLYIRAGEQQLGANEVELGRVRAGEASWVSSPERAEVVHVVIEDDVQPASLRGWFNGFERMESIEGLDCIGAAAAEDFSYMFAECASLTSLDLSKLKTESAVDLSHFLEGCTSLASVVLPESGTFSAEDMSCMFSDCAALEEIDVVDLDVASATDLSHMFSGCSRLERLTNTDCFKESSSVATLQSMFEGCEKLTGFDLAKLDTSSVTDMSSMFARCSSLQSFTLTGVETDGLMNASSMFYCCTGLTEFAFGNVNLSGVSVAGGLLWGCPNLTEIHTSTNTQLPYRANIVDGTWRSSADGKLYQGSDFPSGVAATYEREGSEETKSYIYGLLDRATGAFTVSEVAPAGVLANQTLYRIDVDKEYDSPDDVPWHADREAIKSVSVGVVACSMSYWFCDCPALQSVSVAGSGWVTLEASSMFARCPRLTAVGFDGSAVRSASADEMFADCTALESIVFPTESSISNATRMFAGCTALADADLSNVTYMNNAIEVFDGCTALTNVTLPQRVLSPSVANLFRSCSSLSSVDVSTIDTSYPTTDFSGMFYGCRSLARLDLSVLDTRRARSMKRMFHDCRSLEEVTFGKYFTFRGATFSRLAGGELPAGAWRQDGGDALHAFASDSIPNQKIATYRKIDETTPGLVIESVRGDSDGGSAKYTVKTTFEGQGDALEAVSDYVLDAGYASDVFVLGESAKASSTKTVSKKTVTKETVNSVYSKKVTSIVVGPQVSKIKARAFEGAPNVRSITVKSDKLTTAASVRNCLLGSKVSHVSYSIKTTRAKGLKVKKAFENWAGKKAK